MTGTRELKVTALNERLIDDLVGHRLRDIEWREFDFVFSFTTGMCVQVSCPWRIVSGDRIAFAEADDGQQFGRGEPVNGPADSKRLLVGRTVERIAIRADTADLTIVFENDVRLEIWTNSRLYERWELHDGSGLMVVAMGGGRPAIWGMA